MYALDAIYGTDPRDNYTYEQMDKTPNGGYAQYLADASVLKGAKFGLPWTNFWTIAVPSQVSQLLELIKLIEAAGSSIVNGTELYQYANIVDPSSSEWDLGKARRYPNESEYTYIKVDFYNEIKAYLSELNGTDIESLEDLVQYNIDHADTGGGEPGINPAFASGQDGFLASLQSKGIMDEVYHQALSSCQRSAREGVDSALNWKGMRMDALLVPPDVGQTFQVAAQAGKSGALTRPRTGSDLLKRWTSRS